MFAFGEVGRRCAPVGRKDFALAPATQLRRLCEVLDDLTRRPSGHCRRPDHEDDAFFGCPRAMHHALWDDKALIGQEARPIAPRRDRL